MSGPYRSWRDVDEALVEYGDHLKEEEKAGA
jgi:hypothetical protein